MCNPSLPTDSGEPSKIITTRKGQSVELKKWLGRVKSRQETFFSRVKSFNVMKNRFRHGKRGTKDKMNRHKLCFESVVVLLAYDIEINPLFEEVGKRFLYYYQQLFFSIAPIQSYSSWYKSKYDMMLLATMSSASAGSRSRRRRLIFAIKIT